MSNGPLPPPMSSQYPPPIHPQFGQQPPRPSQPGPPPGMYGAAVPYGQPPSSYPPGSYQVGNQLQSYPAGQTNNGMPQGLHSVGPAPGSRATDWQEHNSPDGRKYYYNKRTKSSSWEKPEELMTPTERADASTEWKEFITGENRKYYFNKVTKMSTWTMPDEMRVAREQAERTYRNAPLQAEATPGMAAPSPVPSPASPAVSVTPGHASQAPPFGTPSPAPATSENVGPDLHEPPMHDAERVTPTIGRINVAPSPSAEGKSFSTEEPVITYATKNEAKNAFKELLDAMHVQSDWTWDQTMRIIINDKRYGALKTLGERKQAFNEYLAQRKKLEIEEKRIKQKKAREEFSKMLEESRDLTISSRWSKVMVLFEGDPRFLAVEKDREREDLFDDFLVDLERKEREKLREEKRKNRAEFRAFLETCDFIKVNTHWRKVQDKLLDDDRFVRLDKADRLEVFQEYIRDLEKEEEEEKKIQKEQQRRKERKNRDDFRSLLDSHRAAGYFNARTQWRDFVAKIKDDPIYQAAASNLSGSTPKELYLDVIEELEKLYHEDKNKVKDIMKAGKVSVVAATTYDEFKGAVEAAGDLTGISEVHVKLVYEDAMEKIKEKEEKEAKKRRRLADEFSTLLRSNKNITVSSTWEETRPLVEESAEYRAIDDESVLRKLFDEHIVLLQQKAKDKERKREKDDSKSSKEGKEKEEKEREKEKEKEKSREKKKDKEKSSSKRDRESDEAETKEEKKRDKEKRHRRHHKSASSEDEEEKGEDSKKSRKHSHRSSRKHHESDSDAEAKPKRHKRDREGRRSGGSEELEDGEVGEDGEIR